MKNKEIVEFLNSTTINAGFIDKLKIKYRPFICPFDVLINYAKNEKTIFDIGCGSGQFCALLAKFTDVENIKGIEINQRLVDNANQLTQQFKNKTEMHFSVFDGNNIPDEINQYDLIYMIDVYHHIPKAIQLPFMKQVFDKMKPNSKLLFKDINAASPLVVTNKLHDLVFAKEIGNEISFASAKQMLQQIGFKLKEAYTQTVFVYPHYFILLEKP
jgi:2-polyprenyl-3-methyl-5-hydroxy-6-metoxy-1,4-benzoquinol methylase